MFYQLSLFIMLLTPVIAYVAGALVFSFVSQLRKDSVLTTFNSSIFQCRNGH